MKHLCRWALGLIAVLAMGQTAGAGEMVSVDAILNRPHVFGPRVWPDELKNKVLLIEYWDTRCPPCRESLPRLAKLQEQWSGTARFSILGCHVQTFTADTVAVCAQRGVNFPVFQQAHPFRSETPYIPEAALADHTGAVVAKGSPGEMYKQVEALVKAVPQPAHPLLGDVRIRHCKTEAQALLKAVSVVKTLERLREKAKGSNAEAAEAAALAKSIEDYAERRLKWAEAALSDSPTAAVELLEDLEKRFAGLPAADKAKTLADPLRNHASYQNLFKAKSVWMKVLASRTEADPKKNAAASAKLREMLAGVKEHAEAPAGVKAEAEALLNVLGQ